MFPLQMGLPGGPELLVILLIMVLLLGVPLALVAVGVVLYRSRSGGSDRTEELEARIDELESELDRVRAGEGADDERREND
ncbi:hypothetical protein [Halorarius halobius]|uniref:hypothetical protein n=1 Tax=Halorarius halobius TaxID=2962671 RepID=UPI002578717C|nr:hypothetical protein [Halorarius halobius]